MTTKTPMYYVTRTPDLEAWVQGAKTAEPFKSVSELIREAVLRESGSPVAQEPAPSKKALPPATTETKSEASKTVPGATSGNPILPRGYEALAPMEVEPDPTEDDDLPSLDALRQRALALFPLRKGLSAHSQVILTLLAAEEPMTTAEVAGVTGLTTAKAGSSLNYFHGDNRVQKIKGEGKPISWSVSSDDRSLEEFDRSLSCVE